MAVRFVGNVAWMQASEIVWTTDAHGLDRARIPYRGAVTGKKAFEDSIIPFAPMASFPRMFFISHSDDGALIFPTVDLHFVGLRGAIPPPKITNSRTVQTVSTSAMVEGDDGEVQASMEASYFASRTHYQWIETQVPTSTPRYYRVLQAETHKLIGWKVNAPGTSSGTVNYAAFVELYNTLAQEQVVSDYTREEVVPGKIWACESVVDFLLTGS